MRVLRKPYVSRAQCRPTPGASSPPWSPSKSSVPPEYVKPVKSVSMFSGYRNYPEKTAEVLDDEDKNMRAFATWSLKKIRDR